MQQKRRVGPPPRANPGKVTAPWDERSEDLRKYDEENRNAALYRSRPAPWFNEPQNEMEELEWNLRVKDSKVVPPWEDRSTELRAIEEKKQQARGYELDHFFEESEETLQQQAAQREAAKDYKFHSMFEVPPMSKKEREKIESYKMNPPFQTDYNAAAPDNRSARKMRPDKYSTTRKPWDYGTLPAAPAPKKSGNHAPPATALWEKAPVDESKFTIESSGDPVLDSLRLQLKKHGAAGIAGLSRKFRIMDDDESGTLDAQEFLKGMKECKLANLTDKAIKHLFSYFDKDDSGSITYDEFLNGVRGVMNQRRRGLVHMAFNVLDKDRSGEIDLNDIKGVYNASAHPDVVMEKRTEEEILLEFIENFQTGKDKDDIVTAKEFEEYYANVSASIDDDDYFELMIRNAWHISGGEGWCANTTNRRVLVTHADGRQTVEEIKNDLGLKSDDKKGMMQRLKAQGLKMATINTGGVDDMGHQYEDPDFLNYRQDFMNDEGGGEGVKNTQRETLAQNMSRTTSSRGGGGSSNGLRGGGSAGRNNQVRSAAGPVGSRTASLSAYVRR